MAAVLLILLGREKKSHECVWNTINWILECLAPNNQLISRFSALFRQRHWTSNKIRYGTRYKFLMLSCSWRYMSVCVCECFFFSNFEFLMANKWNKEWEYNSWVIITVIFDNINKFFFVFSYDWIFAMDDESMRDLKPIKQCKMCIMFRIRVKSLLCREWIPVVAPHQLSVSIIRPVDMRTSFARRFCYFAAAIEWVCANRTSLNKRPNIASRVKHLIQSATIIVSII